MVSYPDVYSLHLVLSFSLRPRPRLTVQLRAYLVLTVSTSTYRPTDEQFKVRRFYFSK